MTNRERAEALALKAWDTSGVKGDWAKHPAVFQLAKAIEAALDEAEKRTIRMCIDLLNDSFGADDMAGPCGQLTQLLGAEIGREAK